MDYFFQRKDEKNVTLQSKTLSYEGNVINCLHAFNIKIFNTRLDMVINGNDKVGNNIIIISEK